MSVKSAQRVLRMFELLAQHPEGLAINEVSNTLSFPQSSTSVLVATLFKEGYLTVDSMKRYKLGPKLIQLGRVAMETMDISSQGLPYLKKLKEDVQETVFMAVLSSTSLVYVAKIDSDRSIRTTAQPGQSKPLYCTGLGKIFLTFLPESKRNSMLDNIQFEQVTKNTITNRAKLEKQLEEFAKLGYSIDNEENEEGLICLAAPIFGSDGMIQSAISVAGPKERMLKHKGHIIEKLLETSSKIAESIGYQNGSIGNRSKGYKWT
ncbi:MAG TPA: IclR family transcriptional regulator [Bacillales bacterium]|nr:IclR family transcriptional regulator [Bacillales bacterium]